MTFYDEAGSDNPTCHRKRKRRKLLLDEKVEVRSLDDGLQGSWHPGTVVACDNNVSHVLYDHVLGDNGEGNFVETIVVTQAIDGLVADDETQCEYRGIIRPCPPVSKLGIWCLHYGLCVDAWYNDAWWEGVIFDHEDGSDERMVFFPDLGDEIQFGVDKLRITQEWNEVIGGWEHRGSWLFLELIEEYEQEAPLFVSVKQIWYDLQEKKSFDLVKEWTCMKSSLWKGLLLEAINDHLSLTVNELCSEFDNSRDGVLEAPDQHIMPDDCNQFENCEIDIEENSEDVSMYSLDDDYSSSKSSRSGRNRRTVSSDWLSVGFDLVPGPKFLPDSVTKYIQAGSSKRKPESVLAKKLRMHLLYLGWEISSAKYRNTNRMRYSSPCGKAYYSLLKVCEDLQQSSTTLSPIIQLDKRCSSVSPSDQLPLLKINNPGAREEEIQSELPSVSRPGLDANNLVPEHSPRAAVNWINNVKNKCIASNIRKKYSLQAKKHLLSLGWRFSYVKKIWITYKERYELRYVSPEGKGYTTLLGACQACVDATEDLDHQTTTCLLMEGVHIEKEAESPVQNNKLFSKVIRMKSQGSLIRQSSDDRQDGSKLAHLLKSKKKKNETPLFEKDNRCTSRVLRSSKRTVRGAAHAQMPRTVLSWLIDNNVILPREKVYYENQNDHSTLEGRITRDGIKCSCCQNIFTLRAFQSHAGSSFGQPAANIFLQDGRSLLECQMQMVKNDKKETTGPNKTKSSKSRAKSDYICSVCQYGGELLLCDQCPSAFHKKCIGLKDVPEGDWFCQSCCCAICSRTSNYNTDSDFRNCDQCEQKYHVGCLRKTGTLEIASCLKENWFCSRKCQKIYAGLHKLLEKEIAVGPDNLTWSLLKPSKFNWGEHVTLDTEQRIETFSKLNVALGVMHECFETVVEARTRSDLVEDVIFSRWSELNRLKFTGFYTILLEKNGELITVATVRVFGDKVAEVPLVATRPHYRRMGMCGILIAELEKQLMELGVERLVLPSVASALHTWTSTFRFSKMTTLDRSALLGFTFLGFQGTVMCQKLLRSNHSAGANVFNGVRHEVCDNIDTNIDLDPCSPVSEVFQAVERIPFTDINRGHVDTCAGHCSHGSRNPSLTIASESQQPSANHKRKAEANGKGNGNRHLLFYKRRRVLNLPQMTSISTY